MNSLFIVSYSIPIAIGRSDKMLSLDVQQFKTQKSLIYLIKLCREGRGGALWRAPKASNVRCRLYSDYTSYIIIIR